VLRSPIEPTAKSGRWPRSASLRLAKPDVVLLDVNLSGELSYDVANHCMVEGVPVMLTTGYQAADIPDGLRHCPVLMKPFSTEELRIAIEAAAQRG